jgi:type VI secretion system protein ImpL
MGSFGYYVLSAVGAVIYMVTGWIVVGLLHLSGQTEVIVRMLVMGLGFSALGLLYYWNDRRRREKQLPGQTQTGAWQAGPDREVEALLREAQKRLSAARLGKDAKLGNLPVFVITGYPDSAKTSTVLQSGTEPDLLAGQVYQDNAIVSTRTINLWLAKKSVLVEAGGKLLGELERWQQLIKSLRPAQPRIFSSRQEAPRAAILCIEADLFIAGVEDTLAAASRALQSRLGELSQILGVNLPVYVLITKLDRLTFFAEFFANLMDEEASQVFGATLPLRTGIEQGVYAEEEARRITAAFDNLAASLCDKRLPFLARDNDPARKAAIYEFPREFRKLRNPAVRFLVDVCRPSQLRANPILRGFYFSGVRPIVVKESTPLAQGDAVPIRQPEPSGIFDFEQPSPLAPVSETRMRRVPQWLFLGHLFSGVILRDTVALGASGHSLRAERVRRALIAGPVALCLLWSLATTTSYFKNRSLESRVGDAARDITLTEGGGAEQELPSRSSLERLDSLRESVELLSRYERDGPPWSMRWGLYAGDQLYRPARRLYFARFHQLLFGATQTSVLEYLRQLPKAPGSNDEYKPAYDGLKAYLITTSHHEKSVRAFLSPVLYAYWSGKRQIDSDRGTLARRQFDFYSDELVLANPFSSENDGDAIRHARDYLAQFNGSESVYQFMLTEASRQNPAVNFNRQYSGSAAYVLNNKDVAGAFTIEGFKFIDQAIHNVKRFFGGEVWVLGDDRAYRNLDPDKIVPELQARYRRDFIGNWRAYLANSQIAGYTSVGDAAQKLKQLSSNQSYLLALFCLASVNTLVADPEIAEPFQPVQYVESPKCSDRLVQEHNSQYMTALTNLQTAMDRVAQSGANPRDDLVEQTHSEADAAYRVTRQIAQSFRIDREGNVHGMVQQLMEEPIRKAEATVGRLGPAQLNSQGRALCGAFADLSRKYPFNTSSNVDATIDDVNGIFRPTDGRLDQFFETNLRSYLTRQGSQFTRKPDSKVQVTEGFLRFLTRAYSFSDALYRNGSREPSLTYTMKAMPAEGVKSVSLSMDGQELDSPGSGGVSKDFVWPGTSSRAARLSGSFGGPTIGFISYDGLWAVFRFFGDADQFQATGGTYTLQWVPRQGQSSQPMRIEGKIISLPFQLDLKGAPPIFQKGYLAGFQCVADVAR